MHILRHVMSQPFPGPAPPTNTSLYLPPIVTSAVSPPRLLLLHFLVSMARCELEKYLLKKNSPALEWLLLSLLCCSTLGNHAVCQLCLSCSKPNASESSWHKSSGFKPNVQQKIGLLQVIGVLHGSPSSSAWMPDVQTRRLCLFWHLEWGKRQCVCVVGW